MHIGQELERLTVMIFVSQNCDSAMKYTSYTSYISYTSYTSCVTDTKHSVITDITK